MPVAPDFVIVGAQKAGTSTLHSILGAHPDVFIPDREVFFFDIDDRRQHPDFAVPGAPARDFERDLPDYARWYARFFAPARPGQRLGEDSTSYLASPLVPPRLARLCPDVKVIALLRDPVARAYSHYWHDVSRGRCGESFARVAADHESLVVSRGEYRSQLLAYFDALPRAQVEVVIFEEFCRDMPRVSQRVAEFLGLSPLPRSALVAGARNVARVPANLPARLWLNRNLPWLTRKSYRGLLPEPSRGRGIDRAGLRERLWAHPIAGHANRLLDALRPRRQYPPMDPAVRERLVAHYARANEGLDGLLGRDDLGRWWPSWPGRG